MSTRKCLLGVFGIAALVAGMLVFSVGEGYSSNWARWFFGPLLWFIGGALVIAWIAGAIYTAKANGPYAGVERRSPARAVRKVN
jgi:putative Mn2+ efflux pump MntP